jgi:hypothetical protein
MPIAYRIDKQQRTLFTRATGVLWDEDLREFDRVIVRDPEVKPNFDLAPADRSNLNPRGSR